MSQTKYGFQLFAVRKHRMGLESHLMKIMVVSFIDLPAFSTPREIAYFHHSLAIQGYSLDTFFISVLIDLLNPLKYCIGLRYFLKGLHLATFIG
jgi:hypothetical protein